VDEIRSDDETILPTGIAVPSLSSTELVFVEIIERAGTQRAFYKERKRESN